MSQTANTPRAERRRGADHGQPTPLSPKKLLLTKWTAVSPKDKEKHWVVVEVVIPEPPAVRIDQVVLEAVHSKRSFTLHWRELTDRDAWRRGWV